LKEYNKSTAESSPVESYAEKWKATSRSSVPASREVRGQRRRSARLWGRRIAQTAAEGEYFATFEHLLQKKREIYPAAAAADVGVRLS
jgi:hypothetical protein